jgi:predicted NUDIX family phosphoesterase
MGMGDEILVVKRDLLFSEGESEGFIHAHERDYIKKINDHFEFQTRTEELEKNQNYQQPIPYVWIVNPETKQIFAYRRASKKENYNEKRLMNKWSCGVGGHIDREDVKDPIHRAMMRELEEEVKIREYPIPKIVGYININSTPVDSVHFGVVAIAETTHEVEKGDDEMAHGQFYSISELEDIFANPENDIENWTKVSWPFVRDYLEKL